MNSDARCLRCGYSLIGLEGVARCPECGLEIDASLSRWELRRSDPFFVANLLDGTTLAVAGITGLLFVALLRIVHAVMPTMWAPLASLDGAAFACIWASAMLLTRAEHDAIPLDEPLDIRKALRIAATAHLVTQFAYLGSTPWPSTIKWLVFWCQSVAAIAAVVFFYLQVRRIGRRIPDAFVIRHSVFVMAAQIAASVMMRWVPNLINLLPRSRARGSYELVPGEILWWVASAYAVVLLWHMRKRLLPATIEARDHWIAPQAAVQSPSC